MTKKSTKPEKLSGKSMDVTERNIRQLKNLFPDVFSEGKINFAQLQRTLGEWVEPDNERFGLHWHGKAECMKVIQQPSVAALKPARDESVNFDDTENLFIEGDNLEVLKLLQKSYFGKVKMVYIDPPYNTGKEFIYPDKYSETLDTYLEYTGQKDSEGRKFSTNTEAVGRYHSNWLNMMYPRLYLARNLLREDGVIAVHIDENEHANLEKLLNEIFGEDANLGVIVWDKRNPKGKVVGVAQQHEYILFYSKNRDSFVRGDYFYKKKENAKSILRKAEELIRKSDGLCDEVRQAFKKWVNESSKFSGGERAYNQIDEDGNVFQSVSMAAPDKPETRSHRPLIHPITKKPCPVPEKGWRFPDRAMDNLMLKGRIIFGEDENTQPRQKYLLKENPKEAVSSLLYYGGNDNAMGLSFDNPKPLVVATKIIEPACRDGDLIVDFFAGSCTTAHAVMQLNKEDGGNRKYICVQLPERCTEKSESFKAGYKTIADLAKERIRRAASKINSESLGYNDDFGFKVFKLSRSNFKIWEGDLKKVKNLEQQLLDHIDHIDRNSSAEDILYEIMLKSGFSLTAKVKKLTLAGKDVFSIEEGALLVCLDKKLTQEVIDAMANKNPRRVICLDEGFKGNDQLKANAVHTFKAHAREQESEIVFMTV